MFKFITLPAATVFTGTAGSVMVLAGHEGGGAIVVAASLLAFVYLRSRGLGSTTNNKPHLRNEAEASELYHIEMDDDMQQRQLSRQSDS